MVNRIHLNREKFYISRNKENEVSEQRKGKKINFKIREIKILKNFQNSNNSHKRVKKELQINKKIEGFSSHL